LKTNMDGYMKCPPTSKKQILFTSFDDLCSDPLGVVDKICQFLDVEKTKATLRTLGKENLPRKRPDISFYKDQVAANLNDHFEKYLAELDEIYMQFLSLKNG
jgi:hypothetical protein